MDYKLYEGQSLEEDEYLLKIRENIGFLSKLTKKNELPKAFRDWNNRRSEELPIYIFKEEYHSGWMIDKWRFGQSQNWAKLIHPAGFTLEIYLDNLLDIAKKYSIIQGEIMGEFKWKDHELIKKI